MSKKVYQVLILCFILSWGLALVAKLNGLDYSGNYGIVLAIAYMFMPAISVAILSKFIWKDRLKTWGVSKPKNPWFILAWIWPLLISFAVIPISLLFPGVTLSLGMEGIMAKYSSSLSPEQIVAMKDQLAAIGSFMPLILIVQSLIAGITINAIAAFGEEYLWRGMLLKELKNLGWIKSSLFIGAVWGLWHAPLIIQGHNYPEHPYFGVLMMIIWCILITPSLIYFTVRTKSAITAAVVHGTINASFGIAIIYIAGGNDLTVGATGLAGFIALIIFNIGLIIIDKKSKARIDDLMKEY